MLQLPAVWAEDTLAHVPGAEIWIGVPTPGTELPERALVIREALSAAGARIVAAEPHDDSALRRSTTTGLLTHLATVYDEWVARGYQEYQHNVVPYVFPTDGMLDGLPVRPPDATHGRAGRYMLRHDDARRRGDVAGGSGGDRRRPDRGRPRRGRRTGGVRDLPAARTPRHPGLRSAARAISTTRPWPWSHCGRPGSVGSPSWTSTRTTATALRRCSTVAATSFTVPYMSIRAPAGFRTTSDTRPRPAAALARARTETCRLRPGTGDDGWLGRRGRGVCGGGGVSARGGRGVARRRRGRRTTRRVRWR